MSTLVEKLSKLTDNLVGIVSPRRQMMREKIRTVNALRAFNGASKGRLLRDWVTSDDSADSDLKYDLEELRKRSRDLMRNDGIRRIQVWEEIWALLGNETTARWFQSCQKLSRDYGVANIAVAHRISDLRAQADDGTAAAKVGAGLLADTQTRVLFRQSADQVPEAVELLGLTEVEAALLPRLVTGRALWHVGQRRGLVQHHVAPGEWPITRTDGALVV